MPLAGEHDRGLPLRREFLELGRGASGSITIRLLTVIECVGADHLTQPSSGTQLGCRACQNHTPGRVSSMFRSYAPDSCAAPERARTGCGR